MANKAGDVGCAVVAGLIAAHSTFGSVGAAQTPHPSVLLRITNAAGISPETIHKALRETTRIYETAAVQLVWVTDGAAQDAGPPTGLDVVLLSKFAAERILSRTRLPATVLGVAPRDTGRAYIFCDRIQWRALIDGVPIETVLGRVVAHEVGHHLLPGEGHSKRGIMQERLNYSPKAAPGFTAEQAVSIRARMLRSQ